MHWKCCIRVVCLPSIAQIHSNFLFWLNIARCYPRDCAPISGQSNRDLQKESTFTHEIEENCSKDTFWKSKRKIRKFPGTFSLPARRKSRRLTICPNRGLCIWANWSANSWSFVLLSLCGLHVPPSLPSSLEMILALLFGTPSISECFRLAASCITSVVVVVVDDEDILNTFGSIMRAAVQSLINGKLYTIIDCI